MIGVVIAEATLLREVVLRLHQALASWESQATEDTLVHLHVNVDETSFRVDMKNYWIHVYSSNDLTLNKFLHRNRGKAAVEAINIIPRYGGVLIHDCWQIYLYRISLQSWTVRIPLRELTFIVDIRMTMLGRAI
ncbi:MAG: transposase [Nitrosomonas sp.]|nr:transposase [Nitrosomonas sp.]